MHENNWQQFRRRFLCAAISTQFLAPFVQAEPGAKPLTETRSFDEAMRDVKHQKKCKTILIAAENAVGVLWIENEAISRSEFYWSAEEIEAFSALKFKKYGYHLQRVAGRLPDQNDYRRGLKEANRFAHLMEKELAKVKAAGALKGPGC